MKLHKNKKDRYCIDCSCNLTSRVYLAIGKIKITIYNVELYEGFEDGYRCKTCAKNYKKALYGLK